MIDRSSEKKYKQLVQMGLDNGFNECEVYENKSQTRSASILKGEVRQYDNSITGGISFRGNIDNKSGYAYSEMTESESFAMLIDQAKQNIEVSDPEEFDMIHDGKEAQSSNKYNEELSNISSKELIEIGFKMEKTALEFDSKIKSVESCQIAYGEGKTSIVNSQGLSLSHRSNYIVAYITVTAEGQEQIKTGSEYWFGNDISAFDPQKVAKAAAIEAISNLGAAPVESGIYNVILKNSAFASLLRTYANVFYAENVQKGFSLLKGRLLQKIASDKITLRDDVHFKGRIDLPSFDSEGAATKDKVVIENGVLKTFLHNLKSAKKDNVKTTGNASRSFKSSIGISPLYFYVEPREKSLEELCEAADYAIMITELNGLHAGANAISGDFSLMCNGFLVEKGKLSRPVEQITVAGNFFGLLENVKEIGSDLKFLLPASGIIGAPSVYVKNLSIGGL